MPVTKNQTFLNLLKAIKAYTNQTQKRITIEYVLIAGINDSQTDALKVKKILSSIKCKLNVIPFNEIDDTYKRPNEEVIQSFLKTLKSAPFPVTVRWSKGQDIDAGCGQLATNLQ